MEYKYSFEKLGVWKDARKFVSDVYRLTDKFPDKEKFGLCSQMQRASVSVVSNIAEGVSRNSLKEQKRFIEIAYGSLMEVYCQGCIAQDLSYITEEETINLKKEVDKIANKLNALTRSMEKRLKNSPTTKRFN